MKSKVFIGSSSENIDVAYAIQENLEKRGVSPTVWSQDVFKLSDSTIESLISALSESNYAVFVFAPDDLTKLRNSSFATVRDNVVFELGLFIGALGRKSCFFVIPQETKDFHLPTDLLGITAATYDESRNDLVPALGSACSQIIRSINLDLESKVDLIEKTDEPCSADWTVAQRRSLQQNISIPNSDTSDLYFLLLSVSNLKKSRMAITRIQVTEFPELHLEAMYDLMGSWDLLIKFRTDKDANEFEKRVVRKLVTINEMVEDTSKEFGRRKLVNVFSQSRTIKGLLSPNKDETIHYTLLPSGEDYEKYRASRAFLFLQAPGIKGNDQRKLFLEDLSKEINGNHGSSIIESVCEGESELIIETFSSCAQSNQIKYLNKVIEPVLEIDSLQKYTLICYHYVESGLFKRIHSNNGASS